MEIPLPEPSPITTALVEQIKNATDALALAGFTPYLTPQAAAEAHPEVFAALIEAQGTGRIAALGWSVAPAVSERQEAQEAPAEANTAQEPPTTPSATPGGHPLDQGGWIRSRVPTEGDGDEQGRVLVTDSDGEHWELLRWHLVAPSQPWAPTSADHNSFSAPTPLPAHLAYPTSDGWIHDRVPGPGDADEDGDVVIPVWRARAFLPWSHVVPGQPWRRFS